MEFHLKNLTEQLQTFYDHYGDDLTKTHDRQINEVIKKLKKIEFNTKVPLLVIDLNNVLIETQFSPDFTESKEGWHRVNKSLRRALPAAEKLFNYLFLQDTQIRVAIWSSSYLNNVEKTIKALFPQWQNRFYFVWGQEKCESGPNPNHDPNEESSKPTLFWKNLSTILEEFPQYHPDNVLIIDDSPQKMEKNKAHNYLVVKEGEDPLQKFLETGFAKEKLANLR